MASSTIKIGKYRIPRWAVIAIMVLALPVGIFGGGAVVDLFFAEPDGRIRVGPVAVGQKKTAPIAFPTGNFTGGQLSMVLDVAVTPAIAREVIVTVEVVDPLDESATFVIAKLDTFDIRRADGLNYSSKAINLLTALRTPRGIARQFDTGRVLLRASVERKRKNDANGFAWVTNASVVGKKLGDR